jgi:hypothetical protein
LPILHFSGKFRNQPPLYNNNPNNTEKYFDDNFKPEVVKENVTKGVDPVEYFEFRFDDVYVRKVTYDDGTSTSEEDDDTVIGKRLMLKAFLVDTAPHLERSRLFAGDFRATDLMMGKLDEGFESDLFTTIRGKDAFVGEKDPPLPFSADFECKIYDVQNLAGDFISNENSRFYRESDIASNTFKIYFHLSKFYYSTLQGEVHGYIGLHVPELDEHSVRIHGRRLLIDPSISKELKNDFKLDFYQKESNSVLRYDLEGTYEILVEKKLVVLRYLNFIPYLDAHNMLPAGYRFFVKLFINGNEIDTYSQSEIKVDQNSISESGGICVIKFQGNIDFLSELSMSVITEKNKEEDQCFMKEPEYDLLISNDQKYLVLESKKKEELKIQVYQKNYLAKNKNIRVVLETNENDNSPTVARWSTSEATSNNDSQLTCYVQALDLEDSKEIDDSVIIKVDEETKEIIKGKLSGDLPWDRYYGNYLSIKIDSNSIGSDNNKEPTIKFNIPVRVLHSVPLEKLKDDIVQLDNKDKIQEVMTKILSYYVRYYPWLHTVYVYKGLPPKLQSATLAYEQFLKIREFLIYVNKDDLDDWELVQNCVNNINHFLDRLIKEDNDWKKMPRSRDFPFNGVEFLKMYKASIIDNMISAIKDERDSNIKTRSENEIQIDMDDWKQIQTLLSKLENMSNHLTSDEDKKLITTWKLQIYDNLTHHLNDAKTQTAHVHKH